MLSAKARCWGLDSNLCSPLALAVSLWATTNSVSSPVKWGVLWQLHPRVGIRHINIYIKHRGSPQQDAQHTAGPQDVGGASILETLHRAGQSHKDLSPAPPDFPSTLVVGRHDCDYMTLEPSPQSVLHKNSKSSYQ